MVQHISIETLKLNKAYRLWNAQIQRSFSIQKWTAILLPKMKGALKT